MSVSGLRFCQYGKVDFVIKIGRLREMVKLMVVDISVDGILGFDFFRVCKDFIEVVVFVIVIILFWYCKYCLYVLENMFDLIRDFQFI